MAYTKRNDKTVLHWYRERSSVTDPWSTVSAKRTLWIARTGDRVPSWRSKVRNRLNASSAMSGEYSRYKASPGWCKYSYKHLGTGQTLVAEYQGDIAACQMPQSAPTVPMSLDTEAQRRAYYKAISEIRALQRSFQGGVFLGELAETLKMIRRPAAALRDKLDKDYLRKLSRRKKRDPLGWTKAIAGTWLENVFGWTPLIRDLTEAVEAYERLRDNAIGNNPSKHFKVSAVAYDPNSKKAETTTLGPISGTSLQCLQHTRDIGRVICKIQGVVKRQVEMTAVDKVALFGFSGSDFLPTVWELIPWSFLIDYFVNIGDILEAATTDLSSIAWTNRTTIRHVQRTYTVYPDGNLTRSGAPTTFVDLRGKSSVAMYDRREVVRDPAYSLAGVIPPLSFGFPGMGSQRWINMTALWSQAAALHEQRVPKNFWKIR